MVPLSPLAQGRGSKLSWLARVALRKASPLAQGRGSKPQSPGLQLSQNVAPRAGAWIETVHCAGAWRGAKGRPSRRGVDRNTPARKSVSSALSPLAQGRGSKLELRSSATICPLSPLAQGRGSKHCPLRKSNIGGGVGRGSKQGSITRHGRGRSPPSRRGVDRNIGDRQPMRGNSVAPRAGAW